MNTNVYQGDVYQLGYFEALFSILFMIFVSILLTQALLAIFSGENFTPIFSEHNGFFLQDGRVYFNLSGRSLWRYICVFALFFICLVIEFCREVNREMKFAYEEMLNNITLMKNKT